MSKRFVIISQEVADNAERYLWQVPLDGTYEVIFQKVESDKKRRTDQQNKAMHKYFALMSEGLNNTEASVQKVCKVPIEWTGDNFKEFIWKPVQQSMFPDVKSTTKLDTKQVSEVYEQVNKIISEEWGVSVPFPSYFD